MSYKNKKVILPKYRLVLSFVWFYCGYLFCEFNNVNYLNLFAFLAAWLAVSLGIYFIEIIAHEIEYSAKKYKENDMENKNGK